MFTHAHWKRSAAACGSAAPFVLVPDTGVRKSVDRMLGGLGAGIGSTGMTPAPSVAFIVAVVAPATVAVAADVALAVTMGWVRVGS